VAIITDTIYLTISKKKINLGVNADVSESHTLAQIETMHGECTFETGHSQNKITYIYLK
jgi:hypothetical protein